MTFQIVTANYLKNGRVVFLTSSGDWSEAIADSYVASTDDLSALTNRVQYKGKAPAVVEPYLIEVETTDGEIWPIRYREKIRSDVFDNITQHLRQSMRLIPHRKIASFGEGPI